MAKQFNDVNCQYGAPMGRRRYGSAGDAEKVRLFKVRLDTGGYDDGGAYWGVNLPGHALYCADSDDYRDFVRALNRAEAMTKLGLKVQQLKRGHDER